MSQPLQQFTPNDPSNGYIVIDNGVPNVTSSVNGLAYTQNNDAGFDNVVDAIPFRGGAVDQGLDAFGNGNIPDYVQNGKSFTCTTAGVFNIVRYKLPS